MTDFHVENYASGRRTADINETFGRHGGGYVVTMRFVDGQTTHHFTDSIGEARDVAFGYCHDVDFARASWAFEQPTPAGFAARPYFLSDISYEFPGFTVLKFSREFEVDRDGDPLPPMPVLVVGSDGAMVYPSREEWDRAANGGEACVGGFLAEQVDGWPADGWKVVTVRSDQTGGMCMVDVVTFENGWCLSLNEECALFWPSLDGWNHCGETHDGPEDVGGAYIDFTVEASVFERGDGGVSRRDITTDDVDRARAAMDTVREVENEFRAGNWR